ncbi:MAG: hypothetical protein QOJ75_2195 [Chloroflexota bacterium]|nr:hypothetical protein [Chloroflexota bacterium]
MFPRRGAIALVTTAIALVLLFNFKTPDALPSNNGLASTSGTVSTSRSSSSSSGSSAAPSTSSSSGAAGSTGSSGSSAATAAPSSGSSKAATNETLTGSTVSTRYGDVQVQVTISNGSITAVTALQLPSGGRSGQISSYVEPILSSEAMTAQSANIDVVSGATYTSEAYQNSLQSALDKAAVSSQALG